MASRTRSSDSKGASAQVTCRFIQSGDQATPACQEAFTEVKGLGANSEWFAADDALKVDQKDRAFIYVFEEFEGPAFRHILQTGSRIYGPTCILHCMKNQEALPRVPYPVFSLAMKGLVVSCTGVHKKVREELHERIQWLSGHFSKDFNDSVTHLVAGEVGSKKYVVAANLQKHIMSPEWVKAVWEASKESFVHASDCQFDEYKCPIFSGFVVTVSGLDSQERMHIKQIVEKQGGRYSGEMKIDECTHLIITEPRGQKFQFAKKWKIHIVHPQWLTDSVDAGYCLEEHKYSVEDGRGGSFQGTNTSTPTGANTREVSRLSDLSAISTSRVDETAMSILGGNRSARPSSIGSMDPLEHLDIVNSRGDLFLDGCKIFLSGFGTQHMDKLRKIINVGGGTRFNQLNSSVSHVVVGDKVAAHMNTLESMGLRPHVVTVEWLVDCLRQGRCMPEESYYCLDSSEHEETRSQDVTMKAKTPTSIRQAETDHGADMDDIVSQYLPSRTNTGSLGESTLLRAAAEGEDKAEKNSTLATAEDEDMTQDVSANVTTKEEDQLLQGKSFVLHGFEEDAQKELEEYIVAAGGVVVPSRRTQGPDYGLVPLFSVNPVQTTARQIVTNAWLQMCIQDQVLYPVHNNELFTPLFIDQDAKPLQGCVLSISGITGAERDVLMHVADVAGATCQEYFVRRATQALQASTHLIVAAPEGSKYEAAKKWKLPAVRKQWLIDSIKTASWASEENYLIDNPPANNITTKEHAPPPSENKAQNRTSVQSESTTENNTSDEAQAEKAPPVEVSHLTTTPLINARVKKLKEECCDTTSVKNTKEIKVESQLGSGLLTGDSPSGFLDLNKRFQSRLDFTSFGKVLQSPPTPATPGGTKKPKLSEASELGELFRQNLTKCLDEREGSNNGVSMNNMTSQSRRMSLLSQPTHTFDSPSLNSPAPKSGPLRGVIIAVSKKLSARQSELNNLASSLGAEYRWTLDWTCTHFIFQGRSNDLNKEFRQARDKGKKVVSPHWLTQCAEQRCRLDEALFPHTYNPSLSLDVSANKTPAQSTRRSARSRQNRQKAANQAMDSPASNVVAVKKKTATQKRGVGSKIDLDTTQSDEEMADVCGQVEKQERENQEDLYMKELQNIMQVSKSSTRSKRRSRRPESVDNSLGLETSSTPKPCIDTATEASQMCEVTWDDPSVKEQQKLLAEELAKNSESFSPCRAHTSITSSEQETEEEEEEISFKKPIGKNSMKNNGEVERVPTPETPSLAFPLPKQRTERTPPMPVETLDDDSITMGAVDNDETRDEGENKPPPLFLLSGMTSKERDAYGAIIEELGGVVSDAGHYDPKCTHLVVAQPTRNEKYLACISSGKWVLHKSYLEACKQAGKFVEEEDHEWGGEGTASLVLNLAPNMGRLAHAAHRWRQQLQGSEQAGGAFKDWSVILLTDKKKEDGFSRLLQAGGATVYPAVPPYDNHLATLTHAFMDLAKLNIQVDVEKFIKAGVHCVKPEYIAAFLTDSPKPEPRLFYIPQAAEFSGIRKRRSSNTEGTPSKKVRR